MKIFLCLIVTLSLCFATSVTCFAADKCYHDMYSQKIVPGVTRVETIVLPTAPSCWAIYEHTYQYYNTICNGCGNIITTAKGEIIGIKVINEFCS